MATRKVVQTELIAPAPAAESAAEPAPAAAESAEPTKPKPKFIYPTEFYQANGLAVCPECGERKRTNAAGQLCPVKPQPKKCWLLKPKEEA